LHINLKVSLLIFIVLLTSVNIPAVPATAQKVTIAQEQLKYGYWEISPTIENVLDDFSVIAWYRNYDPTSSNLLEPDESFSASATLGKYREMYAGEYGVSADNVYTIDPDGNGYHQWGNRAGTWTSSSKWDTAYSTIPFNVIDTSAGNFGGDQQALLDYIDGKTDPFPSMGQQVGPITQIFSSAPEVAFSIGDVYLSDKDGTHWSKLGYANMSEAARELSTTIPIVNNIQNTTYVYKQIPYSFKVLFWTLGDCSYSESFMRANVYQYWQEKIGPLGMVGKGVYYLRDSYDINFDYVDKAYADIDTVEANLEVNIEAPLFTSRATDQFASPDGQITFYYNNTWIGLMNAKVSGIYGGAISPYVPTSSTYGDYITDINGGTVNNPKGATLPTGNVLNGDIADVPPKEVHNFGGGEKVIQPTVKTDVALLDDQQNHQTTYNDPKFTPDAQFEIGDGTSAEAWRWFQEHGVKPGITESALPAERMADPEYWTSYLVAPTAALYGSLANPKRVYVLEWNDSDTYNPMEGKFFSTDYTDAESNYINKAIIDEISANKIDRQYSEAMALDREIPNKLTLSLGAKLRPALHTWTDHIEFERSVWRHEWVFLHGWLPPIEEHSAKPVFDVISGIEIVNVFLTYTITFNVVMIDKYGYDTPITNVNADDDLRPWIGQLIANNTYDRYYNYDIVMRGERNFASSITVAIIGVLWIAWVYTAYKKSKQLKISFIEALKMGLWTKVFLTIVLFIILPIVVGPFLTFIV